MAPTQLKFSYLTRANKNVERKLMFNIIRGLVDESMLRKYQYIGFGSIWFVDFIMAHNDLAISDLISIENDDHIYNRACFNKQYKCIKILRGDSAYWLPIILQKKRSIHKSRIIWLDYVGPPDEDILKDIETCCSLSPAGSIVFISVNSHAGSFFDKNSNSEKKESDLRYYFGDVVPYDLPKDWDNNAGFSKLLGKLLIKYAQVATHNSGRKEKFHPIANIHYKDGAPMNTVGGIIKEQAPGDFSPLGTIEDQYHLQIPVLTVKEKLAIDKLLPRKSGLNTDEMSDHIKFYIAQSEFEAYRKHYRQYPLFHELVL